MTNAPLGSSTGRVMVIALDGATWDLVQPWIADGSLPYLAKLVAQGTRAQMRAELPPSSVPNWPAFMTGKNAGKHGCVWWLQRDQDGYVDRLPIDARSIAGDTIWSYLSAQGKKVIVQNVPVTYPVEPVNGVLVSGLLTPQTAADFVYPASLKSELDAVTGGYRIYPQTGYASGRVQAFVDGQVANIRQHAKAAEFLLGSQAWDFFVVVIGPTDEVAHKCWHYHDPSHPRHRQEEASQYGDSIRAVYAAADEAVGMLVRHLGENDTLIVMSDHGFGPVERFFHANNWLLRQGYLRLKPSVTTQIKKALFRVGFTPRNVYPVGKQLLSLFRGSNAFRQRLDPGRQGVRSPLRKIFLSEDDIDWARTQVVATGFLCSQLFINLIGREPQGIVNAEEYEPLRMELIDELSALVNPITGEAHYAHVYRREELYSGPQLDLMPDLICVPRDYRTADSGKGFRSARLFDMDAAISGTHREEGIFILRGPGIRQGAEIPPIRIFDLAPTIFYRLTLPIPEDLDGQVIASAFEDPAMVLQQVRFTAPRPTRSLKREMLSPGEEAEIADRLRDLGYLG